MFTGIVEELGSVRSTTPNEGGARLELACSTVLSDAELGSSIAVNGCCLTVVALGPDWWAADAQRETLDRTTLGLLASGDPVNLERPIRLSDRLGGHLVQGHVDAVGTVAAHELQPDGSASVTVHAPGALTRFMVEKGSVTVDGVSLTITRVDDDAGDVEAFTVALIPHTLAATTLGTRRAGDGVNLEVDVLAKYVERLLAVHPRSAS